MTELLTRDQICERTGLTGHALSNRLAKLGIQKVGTAPGKQGKGLYQATPELMAHKDAYRADSLKAKARSDDAAELARQGAGMEEATRRLGYTRQNSLERALTRSGDHAILRALRANDSAAGKPPTGGGITECRLCGSKAVAIRLSLPCGCTDLRCQMCSSLAAAEIRGRLMSAPGGAIHACGVALPLTDWHVTRTLLETARGAKAVAA